MALGLRVVEECGEAEDYQHDNEDEVVFPADAIQGDGVDESVEKDGTDTGDPGDSKTTRAETEGPDLARVGGQEGSAIECKLSA